ncbi:single-stranded DNA-binding protein [Arthrobacter sp. A2-55]|uniref:single-stranded DNA-binding protein n=1 Tax=Arthrobacter sp. A2-55 TaxID=2897337 RepID=UPI0021CD9281|nr:single-stranded DNA-binding protein [Arthrobacter sp. A2-55]MCU6479085.1 single-stranded DNA-binding protein [Arthrobacter sp. A2-55]
MELHTFTGNLTSDLELITNPKTGKVRTNFRLAQNERPLPDGTDGKSHFIPFTAYGETAENAVKSLKKGARVMLTARIDTFDTEVVIKGEEKTLNRISYKVDEIGASLRFATAAVTKTPKNKAKGEDSYPDDEEDTPAKPVKKAPAKPAAKKPVVDDDEDDEF